MKLGRKRPPHLGDYTKTKRLRLYTRTLQVPTPPSAVDYSATAAPVLSDIFQNDTLGDCVIAGGYHVVGVETANAGSIFHATPDQIVADYSAIGGYQPGNPATDNGCDEQTALNYWTTHGFADGTKLLGWLAVDATNKAEAMLACYLFENLYFGLELPDSYLAVAPGFLWDVGTPNPQNGHCIMGAGYDTTGVCVDTWGLIGRMTWGAIAELCVPSAGGELYVMVTPDQLSKGADKAPNGIAWSDLVADFQQMGGSPGGSQALTLQNAQSWAAQGLAQNWPTQTR